MISHGYSCDILLALFSIAVVHIYISFIATVMKNPKTFYIAYSLLSPTLSVPYPPDHTSTLPNHPLLPVHQVEPESALEVIFPIVATIDQGEIELTVSAISQIGRDEETATLTVEVCGALAS